MLNDSHMHDLPNNPQPVQLALYGYLQAAPIHDHMLNKLVNLRSTLTSQKVGALQHDARRMQPTSDP